MTVTTEKPATRTTTRKRVNNTPKLTTKTGDVDNTSDVQEVLSDNGYWFTKPHLLQLNLRVILPLLLTPIANGYLLSVVNVIFLTQQWKDLFQVPAGAQINLLVTGAAFGMFTAFLIHNTPWFSSRANQKDRKTWGIISGDVLVISGGLLQATCSRYWLFFIARYICGVGIYIANTASLAHLNELAFSQHKDILGMVYNGLVFVGIITGNSISYNDTTSSGGLVWRVPSAYIAVLPLIQVVALYLMGTPPSLKWLVATGKVAECKEVIRKFHTNGGENSDKTVDYELAELTDSYIRSKQQHHHHSIKEDALPILFNRESSLWFILCATALPFICTHFGNGIILNVLAEELEFVHGFNTPQQQILINGVLLLHNISTIIIKALFSSKRVSEHRLMLSGLMLTGVAISSYVFSHGDSTIWKIGALGLLACVHLNFVGLPTSIVSSSAPEKLGNKMSTLVGISSNVTTLYSGFINAWSMERIVWIDYTLACLAGFLHVVAFGAFVFNYRTKVRNI